MIEKIVLDAEGAKGLKAKKLTRGQVKELRKLGLDVTALEKTEIPDLEMSKTYMKALDWIEENIYGEYDFDNCLNEDCVELFSKTYNGSTGNELGKN